MEVIIQIQKEIALELREQEPEESVVRPVVKLARELKINIRPLHTAVEDETLKTYFVVPDVDKESSNEIVVKLRECRGIEAAYVKPDSDDPSE